MSKKERLEKKLSTRGEGGRSKEPGGGVQGDWGSRLSEMIFLKES